MTQSTRDLLQESVIVAAHPDDEVLWFSSILAEVNDVVLCFLGVPSKPLWTQGRANTLEQYPLSNIVRLDLTEAEVFWDTDWNRPIETEFGLALTTPGAAETRYKRNFLGLREQLKNTLAGVKNVITHNPWGEYGNAEHVQVYRAVKSLQQELDFDLWVSSYFSNLTAGLMSKSTTSINDDCVTRPTNLELARRITELYKKNGCWTWYDDYQWPNDESFFLITNTRPEDLRPGLTRPLNFIRIDPSRPKKTKPGIYRRLINAVRRRVNKQRKT